jgi:cytochrome c-type biogenesis protein CcmH/NrfG
MGDIEAAMRHYKQAVIANPTIIRGWLTGADLLIRSARFKEALNVLDQAHKLHPSNGRLTHTLARLLSASPDPAIRDGDRAVALATQVFNATPVAPHAETLAMAYAETGQCDEAVKWQKDAISRTEDSAPPEELDRLDRMLSHYESERPCRAPVQTDQESSEKDSASE